MMVGAVNFDMGVSPAETLRLVSSEGLAPLSIPFAQNSFSESFHEMMSDGNASQQDSALLRDAMKSISAAMEGNANGNAKADETTGEDEAKGLTGFKGSKGNADSPILQGKPGDEAPLQDKAVIEASLQGKTVIEAPLNATPVAEAYLQGTPVVGTPEVKVVAEASDVKVAKITQETAMPWGAAVYENLQANQNPVNPVNPVKNPLAQNLAMEPTAEEEKKGLTGFTGLKGIADSPILQGKPVGEATLQGKPVAEASHNATPVVDASLQTKTAIEASLNVTPVADATHQGIAVGEAILQGKPVADATPYGKPVVGTPEVRVAAEAPDIKVAKLAQETAIPGSAAVYENLQINQNPVNPVNPVKNPLVQNLAMEPTAEEEKKGLTGYKGLKGIADSPILQGKPVGETTLQGKPVAEATLQGNAVGEATLQGKPVAEASLQGNAVGEATLQGKPVAEASLQGNAVGEATLQGKPVAEASLNVTPVAETSLQAKPVAGTPEVKVVAEAYDVKVAKPVQETAISGSAAVYENLQANQNPVNPVNPVQSPLAQNLAMEAAAEEEKKGLTGYKGLKGIADSPILQGKPVGEAILQAKPVGEATLQGKPVAEVSLNATPVAEATLQSKPVAEASLQAKPVAETSLEGMPVAEADEVKVANPVKTTQARNSLKEPAGGPEEEVRLVAPHAAPVANVVMTDAAPVSELAQSFAASAASAQTEAIAESVAKTVELVNQVVEAVAEKISVTPTLAQGEGEILITLKPNVLDGSEIHLAAKAGELTVSITPATAESAQIAQQNLQRLEIALAEHAPSFHHVAVVMASVKKGRTNETA